MISSRRARMLSAFSLVAALGGLAGCGQGSTGGATSPESVQGATQAEAHGRGRGFRGHRGPGGPEMLLFAALHDLELSPAQKTAIEGAMEKAKPGPREPGEKRAAMGSALAEGVRAGKLDVAAVQAKVGPEDKEIEARHAALAGAIGTLHDTLSKEQRRALVDGIETRMAEHGPKGEHRGPKGEHGPRGDHGGPGGERGGPRGEHGTGHGPMRGGPLGHLLHDLDLSEAQRADIHKALEAQRPSPPDPEVMKKHHEEMRGAMKAKLASFVEDSFDAAAFVKPPAGQEGKGPFGPAMRVERMVKELSAVIPLLQPAQREKLAALLEKGPPGPMGPPHGGPGGRGHGRHDAPAL